MAVSQTIATIPEAPSRADPANFVERHEAVLDRLETLPPEMNTWKNQVNTTQSAINASELQAGQSATTATNAASLALSYSNAEQYADGTTYDPGETVIGSNGTAYRRLNTSAAGDNPVTSTTGNWTPAITALGAMSTFDLICRIAGMAPTLYLNAKEQDYRIYSPATGLTRKALTDIVTTERASDGPIWTPQGKLVQLTDDAPRVTFDPETGVGEGLLVEESATNKCLQSQDLTATWVETVASSFTITSNDAIAPDGTLTGDKFATTTVTAWMSQSLVITENATIAVSAFFKAGSSRWVAIRLRNASENHFVDAWFDLQNGTLGTTNIGGALTSFSSINFQVIESTSDGWHRVGCVVNTASFTNFQFWFFPTDAGGSFERSGDAYFWQADLVEKAFFVSPIYTTTAAATRAADVASITGTTFSDFWNPNETTVLVSGSSFDGNVSRRMCEISTGSVTDRITIGQTNTLGPGQSGVYTLKNSEGANAGSSLVSVPMSSANMSIAARCRTNDVKAAVDGVLASTATTAGIPTPDRLHIFAPFSGNTLGTNLASLLVVFPKALPDATLQQLSALVI